MQILNVLRYYSERYCWDVYEKVTRQGKKCQTGWKDYPGECDIRK